MAQGTPELAAGQDHSRIFLVYLEIFAGSGARVRGSRPLPLKITRINSKASILKKGGALSHLYNRLRPGVLCAPASIFQEDKGSNRADPLGYPRTH